MDLSGAGKTSSRVDDSRVGPCQFGDDGRAEDHGAEVLALELDVLLQDHVLPLLLGIVIIPIRFRSIGRATSDWLESGLQAQETGQKLTPIAWISTLPGKGNSLGPFPPWKLIDLTQFDRVMKSGQLLAQGAGELPPRDRVSHPAHPGGLA